MRFVIGSDEHLPIVDAIEQALVARGHRVEKIGATPGVAAPWGELALAIAGKVASGDCDQGVVCCHTGTGVSIAANKVAGVRAALCVDAETARGARKWNDANVLALGMRLTTPVVAVEIVHAWLDASYEGGESVSLDAIARVESRARRER